MKLGGAVGAIAMLVALSALSRVPWGPAATEAAELRLSWRVRSEPEERCRRRTAAELERLPRHMREEEVCERHAVPYRLHVTVGDRVLDDRIIEPASSRRERPLTVFESYDLPPGTARLQLEFTRVGSDSLMPREHGVSPDAPSHALPPQGTLRLGLDTTVAFGAGRVVIVTYDDQLQRLRLIASEAP